MSDSFREFLERTYNEPQKRIQLLFGHSFKPGLQKCQITQNNDPLKCHRHGVYIPTMHPPEMADPSNGIIWALSATHGGVNDQGSYAPSPPGAYGFVASYEMNAGRGLVYIGGYWMEKHAPSHDGAFGKTKVSADDIGTSNNPNIKQHVDEMVNSVSLPSGSGGSPREAPDKDHHHEDYINRTQAGNVFEMSDDRRYISMKNSSQHRLEIDEKNATLSIVADESNYMSVSGTHTAIKFETEKILDKSIEKASWVGTNFIQFVGGNYDIVATLYNLAAIKGISMTSIGDILTNSASNIISMGATNTVSALGPVSFQPSLTPGGAAIPVNNYTVCLFAGTPHGLNARALVGPI